MATKPIAAAAHRTMYGDAVRAAVDSGDIKTMTATRDEALSYLANADAVEKLLPALEAAIQSKGGGIRPLYAVTIQDVLRRGDAGEIALVEAQAIVGGEVLQRETAEQVVDGIGIRHQAAPPR